MRALVTGANGFLGRNLVDRLRAIGANTTAVARRPVDGRTAIVDGYGGAVFADLLADRRPDVVFHAAGLAGRASTVDLVRCNVLLTAELFAALDRLATRPTLVLIGSAAEYGPVAVKDLPLREGHPCRPATDYGASKYAQTLLGLNQARDGWPVVVARLFNPIGPGMPSHLALGAFAARLARREPVLKVGNLDVHRDFIDVAEAARLIAVLADRVEARGRVVNICAGEAFHLGGIVERMIKTAGLRTTVSVDPARLRHDDPPSIYGSTETLAQLGLTPRGPDFDMLLPQILAAAA